MLLNVVFVFRKIVDNSISPKELVKLSPEELASQELARWREKENQHQLEMIKKTELELMTLGNTYIMKSHKGEQVCDRIFFSDIFGIRSNCTIVHGTCTFAFFTN